MRVTKDILDFLVIGAQKAGTTSLFEYLRHHPELYLPPGKEAPYFSNDVACARGWDSYLGRAFAGGDPSLKWGTVTPQYMAGGVRDASVAGVRDGYDERTVPLRIHKQLPHVRLIAILREPIDRARSHHRMESLNRSERRSFDEAIDELLQPGSLRHSRRYPEETSSYVTWGEYGRILAGYLDVFPREQILVLFTDELEQTPEPLLQRVYEFLDVTPDHFPDNVGKRYRTSGSTQRLPWLEPYTWLSPYGKVDFFLRRNPVVRALWYRLPETRRRWIYRSFDTAAYRIDLWNRRNIAEVSDEPMSATLSRLRTHFQQDADLLAMLLGVTPPWHVAHEP